MRPFGSCGVFRSVSQSKTQDNEKPSKEQVMVEDAFLLEPKQNLPIDSMAASYDFADQPELLPAGWVRVSRFSVWLVFNLRCLSMSFLILIMAELCHG